MECGRKSLLAFLMMLLLGGGFLNCSSGDGGAQIRLNLEGTVLGEPLSSDSLQTEATAGCTVKVGILFRKNDQVFAEEEFPLALDNILCVNGFPAPATKFSLLSDHALNLPPDQNGNSSVLISVVLVRPGDTIFNEFFNGLTGDTIFNPDLDSKEQPNEQTVSLGSLGQGLFGERSSRPECTGADLLAGLGFDFLCPFDPPENPELCGNETLDREGDDDDTGPLLEECDATAEDGDICESFLGLFPSLVECVPPVRDEKIPPNPCACALVPCGFLADRSNILDQPKEERDRILGLNLRILLDCPICGNGFIEPEIGEECDTGDLARNIILGGGNFRPNEDTCPTGQFCVDVEPTNPSHTPCHCAEAVEICNSGHDEDGDGLVSCDDPDCADDGNCGGNDFCLEDFCPDSCVTEGEISYCATDSCDPFGSGGGVACTGFGSSQFCQEILGPSRGVTEASCNQVNDSLNCCVEAPQQTDFCEDARCESLGGQCDSTAGGIEFCQHDNCPAFGSGPGVECSEEGGTSNSNVCGVIGPEVGIPPSPNLVCSNENNPFGLDCCEDMGGLCQGSACQMDADCQARPGDTRFCDDGCCCNPSEMETGGDCLDGCDNDQDGLSDCDDPGCSTDPVCGGGGDGDGDGDGSLCGEPSACADCGGGPCTECPADQGCDAECRCSLCPAAEVNCAFAQGNAGGPCDFDPATTGPGEADCCELFLEGAPFVCENVAGESGRGCCVPIP